MEYLRTRGRAVIGQKDLVTFSKYVSSCWFDNTCLLLADF